MLITLFQPLFAVLALVGAAYVGTDLARADRWWQRPISTLAQVWLVATLGLVGLEYVLFGNNAVLLAARRFDLPVQYMQIGYLLSVLGATLVWARE